MHVCFQLINIYIQASRGTIAASILLGFPLTFEGFRGAFLEMLNKPVCVCVCVCL